MYVFFLFTFLKKKFTPPYFDIQGCYHTLFSKKVFFTAPFFFDKKKFLSHPIFEQVFLTAHYLLTCEVSSLPDSVSEEATSKRIF